MERFVAIEQYNSIVNETKKLYRPVFTNCYMSQDETEKYILQGRLGYKKQEGGLLIYKDEISYYNICFYWNLDFPLPILKMDRPVVTTNIYNISKSDKLIKMEERLRDVGFYMGDRLRQVKTVSDFALEKYLPVAEKLFFNAGLEIKAPTMDMIPQIRECLRQMETIPFYEIPYMSDDELFEAGQEGRVVAVVNREGKVCAANIYLYKNETLGWVGIFKEYRGSYGIAPVLRKHMISYSKKQGIDKRLGWISETNIPSIQFHLKSGSAWTDRYMEYWLCDTE